MQLWKVGNRNLNAAQMRAYRDGKLDLNNMNGLNDSKEELDALGDVEIVDEVVDTPEVVNEPVTEATEACVDATIELDDEELVGEIILEDSRQYRYEELKEMKAWLKPDLKEEYKQLKEDLGL